MISSFSSFKYDDGKLLWGESRQELDFFLSFSSRSDSFLVACTISGRIFPHFPFNSVLSTRKQYFRSLFTIYEYWKQRRDLIHNTVMAIRYEKNLYTLGVLSHFSQIRNFRAHFIRRGVRERRADHPHDHGWPQRRVVHAVEVTAHAHPHVLAGGSGGRGEADVHAQGHRSLRR